MNNISICVICRKSKELTDNLTIIKSIEGLKVFDFGDAPKWYERRSQIRRVSVNGNVLIRDVGRYSTDYFNFDDCENKS